MLNIRIIVLLLLVISCNSSSDEAVSNLNLSSSLKDGELSLSVNNKTQLLKEEGDIVDFHTSADKKSIALEVQKLSTLSVLKLYKWKLSDEKYIADTTNINRVAWENFEQSHSIVVELRGNTGMGVFISDTVVVKY